MPPSGRRPATGVAAMTTAHTSPAGASHDELPPVKPRPLRKRTRAPKNRILFLAANPRELSHLALDEECAAIERELRMTMNRDDFEFRSKWTVSVDEMARHLMELQPTIVHFSGHGARQAPAQTSSPGVHRDVDCPSTDLGGICLQGEAGEMQLVDGRALAMMIRSSATSARIVVLNACYSEAQAEELRSAVDCVIGMPGAIRDTAARSFAVGFYRALGNRRSVGNALAHGVAILAAKQLLDEHLPRCRTRDGVDADEVVLTTAT